MVYTTRIREVKEMKGDRIYRVFFKGYDVTERMKASGTIEFESKNITKALAKAEKMGKKKGMRVAMISEIIQKTHRVPDEL